MREILFRGKNENGTWIEGNFEHIKRRGYGNLPASETWEIQPIQADMKKDFHVDPNTVGQYTGLKDMNGTRIFEGDIVKSALDGINRDIVFAETYYYGWYANSEKYGMESLQEFEKVDGNNNPCICFCGEVIGNIYDNPELLEVHDA